MFTKQWWYPVLDLTMSICLFQKTQQTLLESSRAHHKAVEIQKEVKLRMKQQKIDQLRQKIKGLQQDKTDLKQQIRSLQHDKTELEKQVQK